MYSDEDEERAVYSKKEEKKPEPKKGKKEEKRPEKEESFYDDFYDYMSTNSMDDDGDIDDEPDLELEERKRKRAHFAVIGLLFIVLIFLILLVTRSCDHKIIVEDKKEELVIKTTTIDLYVGEEKQIDYRTLNFKNDPELTFTSLDPTVAEVSNEGVVKGLKKGETEVVITYFVDEVSYEKKCSVIVKEKEKPVNPPKPTPTPEPPKPSDKTPPTLTVNITNAKENTWVNHDVTIKVSAKDDSKVTLKYALDCTNNCTYNNVSNGQITVSKSGTTIVNIQAVDASNNKSSKNVTIKIDKEKPTCSMTVSEKGIITATAKDNGDLAYYGFNSSYSGSSTKSMDAHTGTYTYYVKDAVGNTNSCSITVKSKTQYRSKTCDASHRNTSKKRCNWGDEQFGAWQDTPISGSTYVLVETRTIFYK